MMSDVRVLKLSLPHHRVIDGATVSKAAHRPQAKNYWQHPRIVMEGY